MTITTVHSGTSAAQVAMGPRPGSAHNFSTVLAAQSKPAPPSRQESAKEQIADTAGSDGASRKVLPISLGTISESSPSVSHLLVNHPDLHDQCWKIIFATTNQGKEFTTMRPGTEVFLDPSTKEISWQDTPPLQPVSVGANTAFASHKKEGDSDLVNIGTINSEQPTLSHLLKNHPDYSDHTWDIIFSAENRNKPYTALRPGSQVYIDPKTLELSFNKGAMPRVDTTAHTNRPSSEAALASVKTGPDSDSFAKKFAESVKSYLGRPYQKIDCYGLVVRGLEDLGVHYRGTDGLRQHLVQLATDQGLRHNAYHNGEGLIEVAGNKLFDESFIAIKNAAGQAHEVMNRIKPLLQEGVLLSFSTPTRGHTGVVSQKNGEWTYVNSGVIDHQVDGGKIAKRVGEETLEKEITNWFKLAQNNKTSLKVSAGIFDTEKLKEKARLAVSDPSKQRDVILASTNVINVKN